MVKREREVGKAGIKLICYYWWRYAEANKKRDEEEGNKQIRAIKKRHRWGMRFRTWGNYNEDGRRLWWWWWWWWWRNGCRWRRWKNHRVDLKVCVWSKDKQTKQRAEEKATHASFFSSWLFWALLLLLHRPHHRRCRCSEWQKVRRLTTITTDQANRHSGPTIKYKAASKQMGRKESKKKRGREAKFC